MKHLYQHRFLIRRNLIALIGICLCVYFSYHAIQGERSYLSLLSLNSTIEKTEVEYQALKEQRQALEKKVVMLRPSSINRDLLEERVRAVLGYRHGDELVIVESSSAT